MSTNFTKTRLQLHHLTEQLNLLAGTPTTPLAIGGGFNVGSYYLERAFGGYCLRQVMTPEGGERNVLNTGFVKANTMYELLHAYRCGFEAGKEQRP